VPIPSVARSLSAGLAFRLEYGTFGLDPLGYHLVSLSLHLLNVAGVYALLVRLTGNLRTSSVAALLFGASSVGFTPLNWAAGIIELLTGTLLLAATLLHVARGHLGAVWRWFAALLALGAMLSKETAIAWVGALAIVEWYRAPGKPAWSAIIPAAVVTVAFGAVLMAAGTGLDASPVGAYALNASPEFLAINLSTYTLWCLAVWNPIPDLVAAADPHAWRVVLPLLGLLAVLVVSLRGGRSPLVVGVGWWLAFLAPVLPLAHRSYLYYLYVPWLGGSIAAACLGTLAVARLRRWLRTTIGVLGVTVYALVQARNVEQRATAVRDHLPADRTIRDSELLRHSLAGLFEAHLPSGARVGFVNPVPRTGSDTPGSLAGEEDGLVRTSYVPLEAAMRGGEATALFVPSVKYVGFSTTIPPEWRDVECFYYEQRGWLKWWGKGQAALLEQAEVQTRAGRWASAESTYRRVRSMADTLPATPPRSRARRAARRPLPARR